MKNACAISSLARQLGKVSEKLDSLTMGVQDVEQNAPDLTDVYQGLLLDEIEHVQILTLELTKAVVAAAEETNAGDLTAEKAGDGDGDNGQSEEKK